MTMSTPCPLVIANRTCLSRCPSLTPVKKEDKSREEEAESQSNFSTVVEPNAVITAIPTSVPTSRMTGVPIIFGSFRGPSRVSGSQFLNDDSPSPVPPSIRRDDVFFSFPSFDPSTLLETKENFQQLSSPSFDLSIREFDSPRDEIFRKIIWRKIYKFSECAFNLSIISKGRVKC